ncbi:hypothetical protein D3093_34770 (plasmid) [Azospirillum argentinense]|uniref:Uncharacterized protein n=1 Tax=Azospirillum argentinense TaxID=2970906 RepID=A0A4D8PX11_9PROT|nr:hypothetical protein [Azospirillum argentinense]QCO00419.1 hypothetical protein D3093_34770 [Azospirillum argentinense]
MPTPRCRLQHSLQRLAHRLVHAIHGLQDAGHFHGGDGQVAEVGAGLGDAGGVLASLLLGLGDGGGVRRSLLQRLEARLQDGIASDGLGDGSSVGAALLAMASVMIFARIPAAP